MATVTVLARTAVGVLATLVALGGASSGSQVVAVDALRPLRAADTSSPHDTLKTFISAADEIYHRFGLEGRSFRSAAERRALGERILRCLDLSEVPQSVRTGVGREAAACLKEVLDRIELPPEQDWPDDRRIQATRLTKWRIADTELTLQLVKTGPREGEFLFSPETVNRASQFYELVKHLPYQQREQVTPGLYRLYLSEPGWMVPRSWVQSLPAWAHIRWRGQAIWQWACMMGSSFTIGTIHRIIGHSWPLPSD